MLNQYIWQLYLKAGGEDTVKVFEDNLANEFSSDYISFIKTLHRTYQLSDEILDDESEQLNDLLVDHQKGDRLFEKNSIPAEDTFEFFYMLISEEESVDPKDSFAAFMSYLGYFSTLLAAEFPENFVPYYFRYNFNVLQLIADTFGIKLPQVPKKSDYKGRTFFYADICTALHSFRSQNGLSPYELFAFLYDFAPKYIGGVSSYIITDLPEPRSAFFIGGSKIDRFLPNEQNEVTPWQCSPDTRAGDMIVMYLRTPVSAVNSVWRSCSVGFIDPFFYYYRCTYIGAPVRMKAVSLEKLRSDKITGKMPIVRKNMQGINGVELKPSEYNRILKLGNCKAQRLDFSAAPDSTYSTEKDVEDRIVKPLLKQLGYSEQDYVQQLYLEIGNHNHALIPDFVLLPEKHGDRQSAFAVVEVKRSITRQTELTAARSQVRSYAKLLGARVSAIISQERIWIFSAKDDFAQELLSFQISQLQADALQELRKYIGAPD